MTHTVKLPRPDLREPTVGECTCGWFVLYHHQRNAAFESAKHLHKETNRSAFVLDSAQGALIVRPDET